MIKQSIKNLSISIEICKQIFIEASFWLKPCAILSNSSHTLDDKIWEVFFWHEQFAFGLSTGNYVSGHYLRHYFSRTTFSCFSSVAVSHRKGKLMGAPKTLGEDLFPDPKAILGPPSGHLGLILIFFSINGKWRIHSKVNIWVYRVYGNQSDQLNILINKFFYGSENNPL